MPFRGASQHFLERGSTSEFVATRPSRSGLSKSTWRGAHPPLVIARDECSHSKSTATLPPACALSLRQPRWSRRFPGRHHGPASRRVESRRRAGSGADNRPRRGQPAIQRRVADSVQARRAPQSRDSAGRCQHHAAARGRRSAHGGGRYQGVRRPDRPHRPIGNRPAGNGVAAWSVPAGAQSPFGGRAPRVSSAGTSCQGRRALRQAGSGDLHATQKNARERAQSVSSQRDATAHGSLEVRRPRRPTAAGNAVHSRAGSSGRCLRGNLTPFRGGCVRPITGVMEGGNGRSQGVGAGDHRCTVTSSCAIVSR